MRLKKNEQKIFVKNKYDEKLDGLCSYPKIKKDKYPSIILVHGFYVTKHEGYFDEITEILNDKDYLVFRFDFSGCGKSEGNFSETSITKLKQDLKIILDYVENQEYVDKKNISIIAQSFGVAITLALKPKVKTLILTSPSYNLRDYKDKFNFFPKLNVYKRETTSRGIIKLLPYFFRDLSKYDFLNNIKKIKHPLLIIGAGNDSKVSINDVKKLFGSANNPKELHIINGAGHSYNNLRIKLFLIIQRFLEKH